MSSAAPIKPAPSTSKRPHIYAIDYVRLVVITSVVAVHVVAQIPTSVLVGGTLMLLHVNREIFIMISAFVLTYSYGRRPNVDWRKFFRRRYVLAGTPYIVWTVIYLLADGQSLLPIVHGISTLGYYLITGQARYHLYFLLILFQLYLIFPLLRRFLAATERHHGWLLAISTMAGLVFTILVQRSVGAYGPLGLWLGTPDPWLISYQFFIIAGSLAAWHFDKIVTFVDRNARLCGAMAVTAAALSLVVYSLALQSGLSVDQADTTFQPVVMVQAVTLALWLLALGRSWELGGAKGKTLVLRGGVATFGVYLMHPLIIQLGAGLLLLAGAAPLLASIPVAVVIALALLVATPLVMITSLVITELIHRTSLSLPLAGRPRERPGRA